MVHLPVIGISDCTQFADDYECLGFLIRQIHLLKLSEPVDIALVEEVVRKQAQIKCIIATRGLNERHG